MLYIEHNIQTRQVKYMGAQVYTNDNISFYPGATTILNIVDKGEDFHLWEKANGFNADYLAKMASDLGTKVHELTEKFDTNPDIVLNFREYNNDGVVVYEHDIEAWKMLYRYTKFIEKTKPDIIAVEQSIASENYKFGGQIDRVMRFNDKLWLIDLKTGKSLHENYKLQLAAYKMLWDERFPDNKIDVTAVLHLNSKVKTSGKNNDIQGDGWKLYPVNDDFETLKEAWFSHYNTWKFHNPNWKPVFVELPDHFCKNEIMKS